MSQIEIAESAEVVPADSAEWCTFVLGHPDALPYHHPAWLGALAEAYRYEPQAVVFRTKEGNVLAGTPFVEVGGALRARRWVSLPFTDACPPLTAKGVSAHDVFTAMEKAGAERGVRGIELRAGAAGLETRASTRGVVHELALGDPDDLFRAFRSNVRRNIRKAEASGVLVRAGEERTQLTRTYYALQADTRRRLGVPPQPRRFFEALWRSVVEPGLGFVLLAYHGDQAVAGAVFLAWNGRVVYKYGASDRRHWALRANNLLFWEAIRRSHTSGARVLDFGRSDLEDEGLRSFKAGWGAIEKPLAYTTTGKTSGGGGTAGRALRPFLRVAPPRVGCAVGSLFYRLAA
jgi:CelD/BcsL family acetyltransferase involved in cellulose biosynthesis